MANTFVTPSIVAREALMALRNNLGMGQLVHRDFSSEFQSVGDTVTIRKPATFTPTDFDPAVGTTAQAVTESSTTVVLDKFKDITIDIGSKERALNLRDLREQIISPAMEAMAQAIDYDLTGLYAAVPYYTGAAGTTPDALEDFTNPRVKLNQNKAPLSPRAFVWDPIAEGKLLQLDAIAGADKSGSTDALRRAAMGDIMGFSNYMNQNIRTHAKGDLDAGATAVALLGASAFTLAAGGNAKTMKKGDLFTVAGDTTQYVATADATTAADGTGSVSVYPLVQKATGAAKAITQIASHTANLAFHKNAFALVTAPLDAPMDGSKAEVLTDPISGLTVRVVYAWDNKYKKDQISLDVLYGVKCINPELAVRHLG